jgi:heme exporter protein CcmD
MDLGPYASYIFLAYAAVGTGLAALLIWLMLDGRRQQRLLNDLERGGVRRRSDRPR